MSQPTLIPPPSADRPAPLAPSGGLAPGLSQSVSAILGPVIGLVLVLAIFGTWKPDRFLKGENFENMITNNYHFLIAAVGATFVIVTAGIDLSVGSVMALSCVVCALALKGVQLPPRSAGTTLSVGFTAALVVGACVAARSIQAGRTGVESLLRALAWGGGAGLLLALAWLAFGGARVPPAHPVVAVLMGVLAGSLVGLLNGSLITSLGLPPFIVTLAALKSIRGFTLFITGGTPVSPDDTWSPAAKDAMLQLKAMHFNDFLGLSPNIWLAIVVVLVGIPLLHFTVLGRYAYAIGSNENTARLCGVKVERYKTLCYVIAGATAGLAGVMMCAKFKGGQPTEFEGAELTVIAAVVIGGTSLFGGEGTIVGTALGILMLGLLYSGCVIADISTYVQQMFVGGTILLAAALDRFRHLMR